MHRSQLGYPISRSACCTVRTLRRASSTLPSLVLGSWLLFVATEAADAPARQAAYEIEHLLEHLKTSPCRFNRNGDWYEAAAAHIDRKYRYLLRRGSVV